jgi:membrane protease YdiL (CAAX protease family)
MSEALRRHPVVVYYVLACAITWSLTALINVSLAFGMLALFGPALAALMAAAVTEGRAGVRAIAARVTRVRVAPFWYASALALPFVAAAIGLAAYVLLGNELPDLPGAITTAEILIFFLVIGEEVGWRGYMLEQLTQRWSAMTATWMLALAWAAWHLPLYLVPGMPSYGQPVIAFVAWVIPVSFMLSWAYLGSRSVVVVTLMHGSANVALPLLLPGLTAESRLLLSAAGFAIVASALVIGSRRTFREHRTGEAVATNGPSVATGGL